MANSDFGIIKNRGINMAEGAASAGTQNVIRQARAGTGAFRQDK